MSVQQLGEILLGIVVICWIVYRQMSWRPVDLSRMWRMPAILGIVGVVSLATTTKTAKLTGVDIAALLIEIVVSLGLGAAMGAIARFRPITADAAARYEQKRHERRPSRIESRLGEAVQAAPVTLETRTGWWGLALWIALIAVRIGMDALAGMAGSHLATATGVILIMLAANRAARIFVIGSRVAPRSVALGG